MTDFDPISDMGSLELPQCSACCRTVGRAIFDAKYREGPDSATASIQNDSGLAQGLAGGSTASLYALV
jgi:hypothetical protein